MDVLEDLMLPLQHLSHGSDLYASSSAAFSPHITPPYTPQTIAHSISGEQQYGDDQLAESNQHRKSESHNPHPPSKRDAGSDIDDYDELDDEPSDSESDSRLSSSESVLLSARGDRKPRDTELEPPPANKRPRSSMPTGSAGYAQNRLLSGESSACARRSTSPVVVCVAQ